LKLCPYASLDCSDGGISDCSSLEDNPNHVTVVPSQKLQPPPLKRKRVEKSGKGIGNKDKCSKQKTKAKRQLSARMSYTVATILATWDDKTEFGISVRGMNAEQQEAEVKRLNQAALKEKKTFLSWT
jgi:hypothetical protein